MIPEMIEIGWLLPMALLVVIAWLDGGNRARAAHIRSLQEHLQYLRRLDEAAANWIEGE